MKRISPLSSIHLIFIITLFSFCLHATDQIIQDSCTCEDVIPEMNIEDCCCSKTSLHSIHDEVAPLLKELTSKAYFRYYKAFLHRPCTIFEGDPKCMLKSCGVEQCNWDEVGNVYQDQDMPIPKDEDPFYAFLGEATPNIDPRYFWQESNDEWSIDFDACETDFSYYDLSKNIERFTGYTGEDANRIWRSIYLENCFTLLSQEEIEGEQIDMTSSRVCMEKRVFFRLISGLHTSITVQLLNDYLLDEENMIWGTNIEGLKERVGKFPDRINNLYFAYTFVLRAVMKLSPYLSNYEYNSNFQNENERIKEIMGEIRDLTLSCPPTFDESVLFQENDGVDLKHQFKLAFRNITSILDCVSCEKCRLWGKLQISGLGTALKILFELEDSNYLESSNGRLLEQDISLNRNEIIGLINLLNKLSSSIEIVKSHFPDEHNSITNNK
eukprot:TRINITY_DN9328_c0_g1_i1.p1 TRINITY_DN9328_c0_g1~~TRINITY_DN9328_c0_g1_i1.p1  ORF type:complete len:440 (+),score=83.00 TRINITY_DN9328_c0_g1_i1:90-1409(+)